MSVIAPDRHCGIVELRRYTTRPGRRADFVELFTRELADAQETAGMTIVGHFLDLHDPNRLLWFRGFADMAHRRETLERFYGGPVFARVGDAALAMLADSDDNLLLRPLGSRLGPGGLIDLVTLREGPAPPRPLLATTWYVAAPGDGDLLESFGRVGRPAIERAGLDIVATLVTDPGPNDVPGLSIRDDVEVFVWLARAGAVPLATGHEILAGDPDWVRFQREEVTPRLVSAPEVRMLEPTARSRLRG
jgi:hypothetical protein